MAFTRGSGSESGFIRAERPKRKATGGRRFKGVDHVKVVGTCFSPVLPRVGARVRGDEPLLPVVGRPLLVVVLKGLCVIPLLVAEMLTERIDPAAPSD